MCGFLGSYLELRLGSEVLAMGDGCLTNSGSMACMPAVGWCEGMAKLWCEVGRRSGREIARGVEQIRRKELGAQVMSSGLPSKR